MARLIFVDSRQECLWLTRTARRPVYRPVRFEIRVAAAVGAIVKTLLQMGEAMAVSGREFTQAFTRIAVSMERIDAGKSGIQ